MSLQLMQLMPTGALNGNWKGGTYSQGYKLIRMPEHPQADAHGYVREHRIVYEKYYNCILPNDILIHHKNGIKTDNRIENLEKVTRGKHPRMHKRPTSERTKQLLREHHNPKSNQNRPKGWHHTEEAKKKMSIAKTGRKRGDTAA